MSLDAAAIDLSRAFEYGQGYVALSRVRALEGLYVLGWSEDALRVHPLVASKDEEFRERSDEAEAGFGALEESGERLELEKNFVRAAGGTWTDKIEPGARPKKAKKASTYDETLGLLKEGKSLRDIALARSLTFGTIATHAEKLMAAGSISSSELEDALDPNLVDALPEIHASLAKREGAALAPVYEQFGGDWSYDELRLARLLM